MHCKSNDWFLCTWLLILNEKKNYFSPERSLITISRENICATVSSFIKWQAEECNFIKKEPLAQVFSYEFCKFFKNTYFMEHLWTTFSWHKLILISNLQELIFSKISQSIMYSLWIQKQSRWFVLKNSQETSKKPLGSTHKGAFFWKSFRSIIRNLSEQSTKSYLFWENDDEIYCLIFLP